MADQWSDVELRAQAAYGAGDLEGCVGAWEQLYALRLEHGDPVGAATAATNAALFLLIDTGLMAPVRGWVARAGRALEDIREPSGASAMMAAVLTYERFLSGDREAAARHARVAVDLGSRLGLSLPLAFGRLAQARLTILTGEVAQGLRLLDEVGSTLMSGEVDDLASGMLMCEVICAAQGIGDHERAREWTLIMDEWRGERGFGTIHGRCRLHKAELLRQSGPGSAAEAEALAACAELRPWMRREFGWPLTELGTIRLRRGDITGAMEAFDAADDHGWAPQPGAALLTMAGGDPDAAAREIAGALAAPARVPSKEQPPFGELRLAPLLEAQVEIAALQGDTATAVAASRHLADTARRFPSLGREAALALAIARVELVTGHPERARDRALSAVRLFDQAEETFQSSCARGVLGQALAMLGDEGAEQMWAAASAGFAQFGPSYWAHSLTRPVMPREGSVPIRTGPVQTGAFTASGGQRTVEFLGREVVVRDLTGYRAIGRLLEVPGRHISAIDLVEASPGRTVSCDHGELTARHGPDAGLPVLDDQARAAYRRRLAEIDADIADADVRGDADGSEQAHADREYLVGELSRAIGLGGRDRTTGGTTERARTSVTRTIKYAMKALAEHHPEAAAHLRSRIRTGSYCWYEPDPAAPVSWATKDLTAGR
ncbi:hypothetical protein [Janibacter cremeus]|uniref:Tetratricopeptide (TPR) repeat protein n=1 Tax=Janibacter cremeus TaxID=1285192 RepID=A0A852W0V1_9MICO|nr:hypothetical protein [Janibacter cremeus]NYF99301.1 tetratricopeptide (TPR) repeat protein [Janibacter cremeus]